MESLSTQSDYCGVEWVATSCGDPQLVVREPERHLTLLLDLGMLNLSLADAPSRPSWMKPNATAKMVIVKKVSTLFSSPELRKHLSQGLENTEAILKELKKHHIVSEEVIRSLEMNVKAVRSVRWKIAHSVCHQAEYFVSYHIASTYTWA